jgi:hypothetical protein
MALGVVTKFATGAVETRVFIFLALDRARLAAVGA